MIKRKGNYICVVHGHPQKPGSKTDKPVGTSIKCYSISKFGIKRAKELARKLHAAIIISKQK